MPAIWTNDKSNRKFCNRKGQLTGYALACGYVERHENPSNSSQRVTLSMINNGPTVFEVLSCDDRRKEWRKFRTFRSLIEARRQFGRDVRSLYASVFVKDAL